MKGDVGLVIFYAPAPIHFPCALSRSTPWAMRTKDEKRSSCEVPNTL